MTENAELLAEISRLKAENDELRSGREHRGGWFRSTAVVVFIVLGVVLTIPGIAAPWLRTQLLDTNRWVETMDKIVTDPDTIAYMSTRINDGIYAQVDVESKVQDALPPNLSFAAPALTSQIQSKTQDLISEILSSAEFQQLWTQVVTNAHDSIITFLETGQSDTLSISSNNMLVLNVAPIVEQVEQRLIDRGLTFISSLPSVPSEVNVEIADASILIQAERAVRILQVAAWLFPILAIGCFAAAVGIATSRRRALMWSGLGLAFGALVIGIFLALARSGFVNAADQANMPITVSTQVFNDFVAYLRNAIRVVGLIGLLIALFSVLTGPSSGAVKLRESIAGTLTGAGESSSFDSGPVGRWIGRHRGLTIFLIILLGAVIFLSVSAPSPGLVLVLVILGLLLMGLALFLAAAAKPADSDDTGSDELVKADQT